MKQLFSVLTLVTLALIAFSCSERPVPDPPELDDRWSTAYDKNAEGIAKNGICISPPAISAEAPGKTGK
ncbi:MAG: hypothetical protein U5N26_05865 [Candidatus Marinimicrobia bacterium]|nr:hypothetical protein [Candidatus Neomarinimicrobiota bacterium]